MSRISPSSQYGHNQEKPITPEDIMKIGSKRDYADISAKALFFAAGVLAIAVAYAGMTIGFLAVLSVFNMHPPFALTTAIATILGTIATVVWMRRNWRIDR